MKIVILRIITVKNSVQANYLRKKYSLTLISLF